MTIVGMIMAIVRSGSTRSQSTPVFTFDLAQVHQFDRFGRPFDRWLNRRVKEWNAALDAKEK